MVAVLNRGHAGKTVLWTTAWVSVVRVRVGDMDEIPVRTQDDLCRLWESYLRERRPDLRSLLLAYLDVDDRPTPVLAVDDLPEQPEPVTLGNLMEICEGIVSDNQGGRVALLLVRPGTPQQRPGDRAWAAAILASARRFGVPCAPVHLATDAGVRVVAADDLLPETG
jgi:hypothetical protein